MKNLKKVQELMLIQKQFMTQADMMYLILGLELGKFVSNQNASSVIFKVYVDGELKAQTDVMKSNSPKERLIVDVRNSKKVKLVVEEADNGDTWDHADWADAKFRTFSKFDSTELENTLVEIKDKNLKLSIQQELGLPGEIRLGDMKDLVSLSVKM